MEKTWAHVTYIVLTYMLGLRKATQVTSHVTCVIFAVFQTIKKKTYHCYFSLKNYQNCCLLKMICFLIIIQFTEFICQIILLKLLKLWNAVFHWKLINLQFLMHLWIKELWFNLFALESYDISTKHEHFL
jgi:hypothetical protein